MNTFNQPGVVPTFHTFAGGGVIPPSQVTSVLLESSMMAAIKMKVLVKLPASKQNIIISKYRLDLN